MDIKVDLTPIVVVSVVFLTAAVIVATVLYFVHRARELRHATIRLALEKGQPVPPGLLEDGSPPKPRGNDLSKGVKVLSIGLGLGLFFFFVHRELWPVGFIPGFAGLGYLAAHALTGRRPPGAPAEG
jgi:hypothetical protein